MDRKQTQLKPEATAETEFKRNCIIIVAQRLNEKRNLCLFQSKGKRTNVFEWNRFTTRKKTQENSKWYLCVDGEEE